MVNTKDDTTYQSRTNPQNRALHKWCTEMADELNNAGITMQAYVRNIQVDNTMESVKMVWRAIAKEKYGKTSTASLTTKELQEVWEEMNRHNAFFGIYMPFPSQELTDNYLQSFNETTNTNL